MYISDVNEFAFNINKFETIMVYALLDSVTTVIHCLKEFDVDVKVVLVDCVFSENKIFERIPIRKISADAIVSSIPILLFCDELEGRKIIKKYKNCDFVLISDKVYYELISEAQTFSFITSKDKKRYSKEYLIKLVDEHEVISFDMFDTLVMRKVLYPIDIFEIIALRAKKYNIELPGYVYTRRIAEKNVYNGKHSIYDIYLELQRMLNLTDEQIEILLNLEIEIEKKCIIPRKDIVDVFYYAKKRNKRIYIVSDMYMTTDILKEILNNCGIKGYNGMFVSGEYGYSKEQGLFVELLKKESCKNILHIGDNIKADGYAARKNKIDVFHIESALSLLYKSPFAELIRWSSNINEHTLIALVATEMFNSPFVINKSDRIVIDTINKLSYCFLSPMITGFMLWLVNNINQNEYDGILFSARDCYLIKKLYDYTMKTRTAKEIKTVYFYTSRKVAARAYGDNNLIKKWFPVFNINDIMEENYNRKTIRKNYMSYIKKEGIFSDKKYAFIDLQAKGTIQFFLEGIIGNNLYGYQLGRFLSTMSESPGIECFFSRLDMNQKTKDLLESIFTSFEPTICDFDINGNPIFDSKDRDEENYDYLLRAQSSIEKYYQEYLDLLCDNYHIYISPVFVLKISDLMYNTFYDIKEIFKNIYINDGVIKKYISL